jgi:hypothetical protein
MPECAKFDKPGHLKTVTRYSKGALRRYLDKSPIASGAGDPHFLVTTIRTLTEEPPVTTGYSQIVCNYVRTIQESFCALTIGTARNVRR